MTERLRNEAETQSRRATELQAEVEPLRRRNADLQAHVDSHQEEIRIVSTTCMSLQQIAEILVYCFMLASSFSH